MRLSAFSILVAVLAVYLPVRGNDVNAPEGWVTCASVYSAGDYDLTGGNDGSLIVLRNDGTDMRSAILDAVNHHDIIVFDGSNGDFVLPTHLSFQSLSGRTLIGVNGARLCTEFHVTQEIRDMLDELDVNSLSQNAGDNLGGTLSNGVYVAEQCELTIRQALIDRFGDPKEPYRYAGVFLFSGCSNIIIRNLDFSGPGSLDVGGSDLLTLNGCDHVWVDHCRFTDGLDGNLDIVNNSDFVTVSDTHFRYTGLSYNHPLSNLVSGVEVTDGSPQKCNVSWIRCFWDEGCRGRMPFTSLGVHHMLNCYWNCTKGVCVDAHDRSKNLIENSYFSNNVGKPLAVRHDDVAYEWRGSIWDGHAAQQGNAAIDVPYTTTVIEALAVPAAVDGKVGATLVEPFTRVLTCSPQTVDFGQIYADNQVESQVNISAYGGDVPPYLTLMAPEGIMLSSERDGEYTSTLRLGAVDENLLQADVYIKCCFSSSGSTVTYIEASAPGQTFAIPVKADVIAPSGERMNASLRWPFDKGASGTTEAATAHPEVFAKASFNLGEKINIHSSQTVGGMKRFTLFNPTEAIDRFVDSECCITFDVVTAPDYIFVPKKLSLDASRIGTDMCYIDIVCSRSRENVKTLISGIRPNRSSDSPAYTTIELPLGDIGVGDALQIKIYLYYMSPNKQLAIGDVMIEGDAYTSDSAIGDILVDETPECVEFYDLMGRRTVRPRSGRLYVRRCTGRDARLIVCP